MIEIKQVGSTFIVRERKYFIGIPIGWKVVYEAKNKEDLTQYLKEIVRINRVS